MAVAALLLDLVFAVVAVGLRTFLHWRRTGASPFRSGGAGLSGPVAVGGLAVVIAIGPVLALSGVLEPANFGALSYVGLALMAIGIAGTAWSQAAMGDSWRIGVDTDEHTELVTSGPFRRVRNPIFSSMFLLAAGQVLAVPNIAALASAVVLYVTIDWHVRAVEEPYLLDMHGDTYRDYMRTAGRFLPKLKPVRASHS